MAITFTNGLTPTFPADTFGKELDHIKLLYAQVDAGTGYVNVLKVPVETLVAKIDTRVTELTTAKTSINSIIASLEALLVVPTDPNATPPHSQPLIDPLTGLPVTNIPECWSTAGHTGTDIQNIINALNGIITNIDTAINTVLPELKDELNTPDIDNFKLHMDLLSGIDIAPPPDIVKPNNPALMGLVRAVTDIEHRFGISFTNYLVLVFETLFIGDLTVANAQTSLNAEPFVGTFASLNVVGRVSATNVESNAPTAIIADINTYSANFVTWRNAVATHKPIFEQHITDDMAEYNSLQDKLARYVQAYQISAYITDPYYAFMFTDVFGSSTVINIINQFQNGDIT